MPNNLDLPDDLNRLIEKRERDEDRRGADGEGAEPGEERRSGADRRADSQGGVGGD